MLFKIGAKNTVNTNNLPDLLKEYGLRVSKPYGVLPTDVENLVLKFIEEKRELKESFSNEREILNKSIEDLSEVNAQLSLSVESLEKDKSKLQSTINQLMMDLSLVEIADSSEIDDYNGINNLNSIKANREYLDDEYLDIIEI